MPAELIMAAIFERAVLALTPIQRWQAARRFADGFVTHPWFIITGIVVIALLTILLFWVSYDRRGRDRKGSEDLFAEYSTKRGLSGSEREMLLEIARNADLKRSESVFTMSSAFDRGAAKVIEQGVSGQGDGQDSKQLKKELSILREKLGFRRRASFSSPVPAKSKRLSSRQIPDGKKVRITRRKAVDDGDIESTVVKNNDGGLAIKLMSSVKVTFGEFWCVRYYFGASVWEFEASVISYDGDVLVLDHSDDVRFINRRRFLRVPVRMAAYVAVFPFSRTVEQELDGEGDLEEGSVATWGPPEFVAAVLTELAGPGLRIETELEVQVGDRVLVVVNLDEDDVGNAIEAGGGRKRGGCRVVEDVGEVRHIQQIAGGLSIAIELTGLGDSDVDELIRATNAASLRASSAKSRSDSQDGDGVVVEAVVAGGGIDV